MKSLRDSFFIQFIVNNGVKDATQRVPLQLKVTFQFPGCHKKFHNLLLPEPAVAIGEGGLDVHVLTFPPQVQSLVVVPQPYLGVFPLTPRTIVLVKRLQHRSLGPDPLV